jgi:hypothetical protein
MAGLRLCLYCGEFAVVPGEWDEICPECKKIHGIMDRPEPPDVGECECWFDGSDCKIHHCQQRRALANKQLAEGKTPEMPQCALCEKKPKYMPKQMKILGKTRVSICEDCGKEFICTHPGAKYCRKCKDSRQKAGSMRSVLKSQIKRLERLKK